MSQRERQTTRILCIVCFSFLVFILPVNIDDQLSYFGIDVNPYIALAVQMLYWLHYNANFFIYAARSDQYRKAYLFFLGTVTTYSDIFSHMAAAYLVR